MDDKYQCHICMELANKPVVTPCGHMFCWPCIYHWLRSNQQYLTCPICKSGLQMSALRPIIDPNQPEDKAEGGIPPRPRPFKKPKQRANKGNQLPKSISNIGINVQRGVLLAGYGIFPAMFMGLFNEIKQPQKDQSPFQTQGTVQYKLYGTVKKCVAGLWVLFFLVLIFLM